MAATLKDIAKLSGVSMQTVSRILRGQGQAHSVQTRERVLELARTMDYRPNLLSRALLGEKSMVIGLIMRGLGGQVAGSRVRRFVQVAHDAGYLVNIIDLEESGDDSEHLVSAAKDMLARHADGLVIYRGAPISIAACRYLKAVETPLVFIDWAPQYYSRWIAFDRDNAMKKVASHLHDLGHRRVAYFPSRHAMDFPSHKVLPYQRAFASLGMELVVDARWVVEDAELREGGGAYAATESFLRSEDACGITALVFNNDEGAIAGLAAVRDCGLNVPGDLSVVGFDDLPLASFSDPPLTTVAEPRGEVGAAAFEMLQQLMGDAATPVHWCVFPLKLTIRKSTGNARKHKLRRK